jgi:hypothetical protein
MEGVLPILLMNTAVLQLITSSIELISTVESLHIDPFLLCTSLFQLVGHVILHAVKNLFIELTCVKSKPIPCLNVLSLAAYYWYYSEGCMHHTDFSTRRDHTYLMCFDDGGAFGPGLTTTIVL